MQPINMIMIYYRDKCNSGHLEHVHPLSMRHQNNGFFNCNYISFQDMQSFFEFLVSVINHYHNNGLHLFWDSFEWFCLQISRNTKYFFLSYLSHCDQELIVVIVYYFQIWNKKEHNIISSKVISSHMGPMYSETPYINVQCTQFPKLLT